MVLAGFNVSTVVRGDFDVLLKMVYCLEPYGMLLDRLVGNRL